MRKQINTENINDAYKEVEIKSAAIIGLDYGFETTISRKYRGTVVKLSEIYTDKRDWDIEEIVIQFFNNNKMNCIDDGIDLRDKIRVSYQGFNADTRHRRVFEREIFNGWDEAIEYIMHKVWNIETQE